MTAIRAVLVAAICSTVSATQTRTTIVPAQKKDVTVASGKLEHHYFTNDLFHIDKLWMQISSDTLFHKWLSQAINDKVVITMTAHPEKFGDRKNVRILTGRLIHQLAPSETPIVHILFLQDEALGTLGAVTFETDDPVTAFRFDGYDDTIVSIVIQIK